MAITADKLHPRARAIVDAIASTVPPLSSLTPEQARALPLPLEGAPEPVASVLARGIPGPAGILPVRIYTPATKARGALVYLHGGGWVIGSLDGADATCRALTARAGVVVVSVAYRLAPETRFPGPVEDAYAGVVWTSAAAAELGVHSGRVAVGGSSAGGNLAAAAALVARDRGGPALTFQLLSVPATDFNAESVSYQEFSEGYGLTRADMLWYARLYLGDESQADHPYASVARADLRDLPPAFVVTAECDPLRDDGERYAERLRAAGVRAEVKRYAGMPHGFIGFPLPEAHQALDDMAAALRAALP